MNEFEKEMLMELITIYINSYLKNEWKVKNWGFSVSTDGKYDLIVRINYIEDFHSRDILSISNNCDLLVLEALKNEFMCCFRRHLEELEEHRVERLGRK